jgi:hypothetical protein
LIDDFSLIAHERECLGFVVIIPQVHQLSLPEIVGFVREFIRHAEEMEMDH